MSAGSGRFKTINEERSYMANQFGAYKANLKANRAKGLIIARSQRAGIRKGGGFKAFDAAQAAARGY